MLTTDQRNLILYQSQLWIAETGYALLEKEQHSDPCDCTYQQIYKVQQFICVLQDEDVDLTLTEKQQDVIYECLRDSLNLQNYPVTGTPFELVDNVTFLIGAPGPPGANGINGVNGTDANIDVVGHADGNITVVESIILGVKTFTLQLSVYTAPALTISLDDASVPDPDQFQVVETGNILASLPIAVNLTKGRNLVTASTFLNPGALNTSYQSSLNLASLNSIGTQLVTVIPSNVSVTTTYSVNITDGTNTPVASSTLTFTYATLYGATPTSSTAGIYGLLSKLIKTKQNNIVNLNGSVQYFWYGFPVGYGTLTRILDGSGFNVTSAFTFVGAVSVTSVGLAANYTTNYNFYRTTVATSISNQLYTFEF